MEFIRSILIVYASFAVLCMSQISPGQSEYANADMFADCQDQFSVYPNDLFECLAYKLVLSNNEKFNDDTDTLSHLSKPILTKTYENKTVANGENVTFTCESTIDSYPIFFFYKLNLFNDNSTIIALQDRDAMNDLQSISANIKLHRDEHLVDPNSDAKSDFETVHLTVLSANVANDAGYYMCIVANSVRSYRITYAYLDVIETDLGEKPFPFGFISEFMANNKITVTITGILLFLILLISALVGYIGKKYKNEKNKRYLTKYSTSQMNALIEKTMSSMKKNFVYVTMPNGSNSIASTLSHTANLLDQTTIDETESSLNRKTSNSTSLTDLQWEFPRERLKLGRMIDEGAFGRVYLADAYGIIPGRYKSIVAVKMIKENATKVELNDFIKELEIMKNVGKHENIISLLGCCTKSRPLYAIVEYAKFGNLRNYLRTQRPHDYMLSATSDNATNQESDIDDTSTKLGYNIRKLYSTINKKKLENLASANDQLIVELLKFCVQIASGMKYLHSKKVCHRDLAARNILLDELKTAKIADFGLARDLQNTNYYRRKSESKLPVRWMSPETLFDHKVYPNSDIWSFGILMWEIFTLGGNPYPTVPVENLFDYLKEGNRMSKPMYCDDELYKIMLDCWIFKSEHRPSFDVLFDRLNASLETYKTKSNDKQLAKLTEANLDLDFQNFISTVDLKKQMDAQDTMLKQRAPEDNLKASPPNPINSNYLLNEKRFSESDDSQYFSGTDISNSLLYVDSSNVSSSASSHYSPYIVPSTIVPSLLTTKFAQSPPSPPPPKPLVTLLNLASVAHNL